MVEIVKRQRKSPVLTPSRIPCLSKLPTINITRGCCLGCKYCYIQGYADYPGAERVVIYENTAGSVAAELSRKRKRPRRVFFSPSSDAFQYLPEVQEESFQTMSVLLRAGVEVAFLTKGFVTERFVRLFSRSPELVFAQVGITTLDEQLSRTMEPRASHPRQRLDAIGELNRIGVRTTVRLDPLVPDLTDLAGNLIPLFTDLRKTGVSFAAASYLFLRPGLRPHMATFLDSLPGDREKYTFDSWPRQGFAGGCGGGRMLAYDERCRRFGRIQAWGEEIGIRVVLCRCKNPDLGGVECEIMGPRDARAAPACRQGLLDFGEGVIEPAWMNAQTP